MHVSWRQRVGNTNTTYLCCCRGPGVLIPLLSVLPLPTLTISNLGIFHDIWLVQEFEAQIILGQCKINAVLTKRAQNKLWGPGSCSDFCPQNPTFLCLAWSQSTYRHHKDVLWTKHVISLKGIFSFYFFPLSIWSSFCSFPFPAPSSWSQGPE